MSFEEYLFNIALIALVIRQIRGRKLTWFSLVWPIGLVAYAAVTYLRSVPAHGNNIALVAAGAITGMALGCLCGRLTRIYRNRDGVVFAKATSTAATFWVIGVGSRLGFALYAKHGGEASIAAFSAAHAITSEAAWTACLILMALAEVLARTAFLAPRLRQLQKLCT